MHCIVRKVAAASLFCVLLIASTAASALRPVDYADVWWNPAESGWGLQIADQGDLLFLTFYVYGTDNKPTWYTSIVRYSSTTAAGARVYTGDLNAFTGPFFGAPFGSVPVVARIAGTATFQADSSTTATLTYTVDGTPVTKSIQRLTYNLQSLAGTGYIGSFIELDTGCTNPARNGPLALNGTFNITHSPPAPTVTIVATLTNGLLSTVCTWTGAYSQAGRYGIISAGTFSCTSGDAGTFTAHDIELTSQGILGRYDAVGTTSGCRATGGFGGLLPT
jgi:hypothetical protein